MKFLHCKLLFVGLCCASLLLAGGALADDVFWFGAVSTAPSEEKNIPPELKDFSLQVEQALQAPVYAIHSKKRKVVVGTKSVFRLDIAREPTLEIKILGRQEAAYTVRSSFLLSSQIVFNADFQLARNQPLLLLLPKDTIPGVAGLFVLLR